MAPNREVLNVDHGSDPQKRRHRGGGRHRYRGDDAEYDAFFRIAFPRLVDLLRALGASAEQAQDAAQDALLLILEEGLEHSLEFAELIGTTYALRAMANDIRVHRIWHGPAVPREVDGGNPEVRLQHTVDLTEVLAALTPRPRRIIELIYEGYSTEEIARLLRVDPATVRSNLRHARRQFAQSAGRIQSGYDPGTGR
jgi:RNA polymerase sigma factor (sigma-70 family)